MLQMSDDEDPKLLSKIITTRVPSHIVLFILNSTNGLGQSQYDFCVA